MADVSKDKQFFLPRYEGAESSYLCSVARRVLSKGDGNFSFELGLPTKDGYESVTIVNNSTQAPIGELQIRWDRDHVRLTFEGDIGAAYVSVRAPDVVAEQFMDLLRRGGASAIDMKALAERGIDYEV